MMMNTNASAGPFDGKAALVTGGASGIGLEVATQLLEGGARVAIVDREIADGLAVVERFGDAVLLLTVDVTSEEEVADAVDATVERFGGVDVAVAAAGIAGGVIPADEVSAELWSRVLSVNVDGVFFTLKHVARAMIARGRGGAIVSISSINAVQPAKGMAAYCVSKSAVSMLTKVAAMDLAPHGIRVTAVGPGVTATPMTARSITSVPETLASFMDNIPAERLATTGDIAAAVCFLASDAGSYITGQTTYVDGGMLLRAFPQRPPTAAPVAGA